MDAEGESASALRENISTKGTNSYYYAHGNTPCGPAWDGKEAPKLLSRQVTPVETTPTQRVSTISEYSWADGRKTVSVYVELSAEEMATVTDTEIDNSEDSFDFQFVSGGKVNRLCISPLSEAIESATYKKKEDKFLIQLKKATELPWTT